jgi:hypothetical protein
MPADFRIIPHSSVNKNRSPIFYRQLCPGELAALLRKSHKQMQIERLNTGCKRLREAGLFTDAAGCCGQAFPSDGETAGQPMNTHFSTSEDSVQPESAEAFWPA